MRTLATTLLLLLVGPTTVLGGPWTQPRGHGYAQLAIYTIAPYDRLITESGDVWRTDRELTDTTLEFYGEHGLSDAWTLIGVLPVVRQSAGDRTGEPSLEGADTASGSLLALGNAKLGLRRRLLHADWVVAVQLDVSMPTARYQSATGLRTGLDAWSFAPVLSAGRGSASRYWSTYAGPIVRTDGYADAWRAGIESGWRSGGGHWWWIAAIEATQSLQNGTRTDPPANRATGLYVDEQEVVAPVLKALYQPRPDRGLLLTVQGGFTGNFVARSPFVGLGAFARY